MKFPGNKNGLGAALVMIAIVLSITWFYDLGIHFTQWSQEARAFWLGILIYLTGMAYILGSTMSTNLEK